MENKWLRVKPQDVHLFRQTFGASLEKFFDGMTGFDILTFEDDYLRMDPESEQSVEDVVLENYGDEAVELIKRLIQI